MSPRASRSPHAPALAALGLDAARSQRLAVYLDRLAAWSRRVNLTGARTPAERVGLLVADVLPLAPCLEPGRLIDVGSGNGSPGLVLALLRPDVTVTLLEPRLKRWAFLREAAREAGRDDVEVVRVRHDGYAGPPARNVTLRAVGLPLEALTRLVEPGGQVLLLGGGDAHAPGFEAESGAVPAGRLGVRIYRRQEA